MTVQIELYGLRLEGHHGVEEDERARGQTFLFDLWLDVSDAGIFDRIEETVDYREVARAVQEVGERRRFHLLEALAAEVADALIERFGDVERVRVRVRKPEVRLDPPVEYSAVSVERTRR
jgi:7,8-dihydroneopterin aldolase/epimerase/oxygenase